MFSNQKPLHIALYVIGVAVIFFTVYLQYFVQINSAFLGYLLIYGIPIAVTGAFFGREILKRAAKNNREATKYGFGMFGALTLVNFILIIIAVAILSIFIPQTTEILQRPNPVLDIPPAEAWIYVGFSFLIIGPAEEFLFRGFMYGGLLNLSKGKGWLPLAILSSALFASVHGYYAITYEAASVVPFITLGTFGFAMCAAYYYSGGNLLLPILIHGAYDATGFLTVAVSEQVGLAARSALIFAGVAFMMYLVLKKLVMKPFPPAENPAPSPPPAAQL
jgi:membrane protease YdiL (CAAX protease family)